MNHTVAVGEFEGPLGLLLDLVERKRLPVSEISVGQITSDYLTKVREFQTASLEEMGEFLQLGARLLYIKSLALLPASSDDEQALELRQLRSELAEYRRFQEAAKLLTAQAAKGQTWQRPAAPRLAATDLRLPLPNLTLEQLAGAFTRALKQMPEVRPAAVIKQHLSLEAVTAGLRKQLKDGFELQSIINRCRDRLEIIVTFLAVLELVRGGSAKVTQAGQFDPIRVEAARA